MPKYPVPELPWHSSSAASRPAPSPLGHDPTGSLPPGSSPDRARPISRCDTVLPERGTEFERIVLASRNPGKLAELRALMAGHPAEFLSATEAGAPEVEETGLTFEENARLKATVVALATGLPAIADDSGLEVPDLGGEPGVRSARYSGEGTDMGNIRKLLAEIGARGLIRPAARFVCAIALAVPGEVRFTARGEVEGWILPAPVGTGGFGYDPVFFSPELDKAFGVATREEKASVSHRGRALRRLRDYLVAQ